MVLRFVLVRKFWRENFELTGRRPTAALCKNLFIADGVDAITLISGCRRTWPCFAGTCASVCGSVGTMLQDLVLALAGIPGDVATLRRDGPPTAHGKPL